MQKAYNAIAYACTPAVVSLRVETEHVLSGRGQHSFGQEFFERWFGFTPPQQDKNKQRKYRSSGVGSGFVISADGYLISNHHVVDQATKVFISFEGNDEELEAEVVGTDPDTDLALLKIKGEGFPYLTFNETGNVSVGDIVVAIGNPFGFTSTFTSGIVSAKGRSDLSGGPRYQNFIQTDVAINPGNSGGPLLNIYGKVVGVNSMIYSRSGGNMGIGFAIPSQLVIEIVEQLKSTGKIVRGWLGVAIQDIDPQMRKDLNLKSDGVYIPQVIPEGPADKAGLLAGDIILRFDNKPVDSSRELMNQVARTDPGKTVPVEVWRQQKKKILKVKISEKKDKKPISKSSQSSNSDPLGIRVKTYESNKGNNKGVEIIHIDKTSPLAKKNVQPGDIIEMINYQYIQDITGYEYLVKNIQKGKKIILHISRDGFLRPISVTLEKN